jgi:8-oxo-dGTP diphosphatase
MANREYPDCPRVGVGAVVIKDDRIILVRRGCAPSEGLWAIPGGMLELGETIQEAADREMFEETGVTVRAKDPVYTFDFFERDDDGRVRFHFIIIDVAADYIAGKPVGADDAAEARWFTREEIENDTFPVAKNTVKLLKAIHYLPDGAA